LRTVINKSTNKQINTSTTYIVSSSDFRSMRKLYREPSDIQSMGKLYQQQKCQFE